MYEIIILSRPLLKGVPTIATIPNAEPPHPTERISGQEKPKILNISFGPKGLHFIYQKLWFYFLLIFHFLNEKQIFFLFNFAVPFSLKPLPFPF